MSNYSYVVCFLYLKGRGGGGVLKASSSKFLPDLVLDPSILAAELLLLLPGKLLVDDFKVFWLHLVAEDNEPFACSLTLHQLLLGVVVYV